VLTRKRVTITNSCYCFRNYDDHIPNKVYPQASSAIVRISIPAVRKIQPRSVREHFSSIQFSLVRTGVRLTFHSGRLTINMCDQSTSLGYQTMVTGGYPSVVGYLPSPGSQWTGRRAFTRSGESLMVRMVVRLRENEIVLKCSLSLLGWIFRTAGILIRTIAELA
jgi:hypothetical protein